MIRVDWVDYDAIDALVELGIYASRADALAQVATSTEGAYAAHEQDYDEHGWRIVAHVA